MVEPGDVGEIVIGRADRALEQDHGERGIEDLFVLGILAQRLAEPGDRFVAMPHNVVVDLLANQPLCRLEVDSSDAETAMEVTLVGLQSTQYHLVARMPVLIEVQDGEDQARDIANEVVEEVLILVAHVDAGLDCRSRLRDGRVNRRRINRAHAVNVTRTGRWDKILVGEQVVPRERGQRSVEVRRRKHAECRDGGVMPHRHIVHEGMALGLDINFVRRIGNIAQMRRWDVRGKDIEMPGEASATEIGGHRSIIQVIFAFCNGELDQTKHRATPARDLGVLTWMQATPLLHFRLFDPALDLFLLDFALLGYPPPHGPLIFTLHAKIQTGRARWVFLVAFLPAKAARKAT